MADQDVASLLKIYTFRSTRRILSPGHYSLPIPVHSLLCQSDLHLKNKKTKSDSVPLFSLKFSSKPSHENKRVIWHIGSRAKPPEFWAYHFSARHVTSLSLIYKLEQL